MSTKKALVTLSCDAKGCDHKHVSEHGAHPEGWTSVTVYRASGVYPYTREKDYCPEHAETVAVFEAETEEVAQLRAFRAEFVKAFGQHTTVEHVKTRFDKMIEAEEAEAREAMARHEDIGTSMVEALRDVASALRGGAL